MEDKTGREDNEIGSGKGIQEEVEKEYRKK